MSWLSDVGDFIGNHGKQIVSFGSNLAGSALTSHNQDNYIQSLRDAEQRNYDDAKAYNDAYNQYAQGAAGVANANSRAKAAAASANDAAAMAAAGRALDAEKKGFKGMKKIYAPYVQAGKDLLPQMEGVYSQGLKNLTMGNAYFVNPDVLAKINTQTPSWEQKVPIPKILMGKKA